MAKKQTATVVIEILEGTNCDGEPCRKGDVVEASRKDGTFLINVGKAEETNKKVGKAKVKQEPDAPAIPPAPGLNTENGPK